jgi:hypothetical protein
MDISEIRRSHDELAVCLLLIVMLLGLLIRLL